MQEAATYSSCFLPPLLLFKYKMIHTQTTHSAFSMSKSRNCSDIMSCNCFTMVKHSTISTFCTPMCTLMIISNVAHLCSSNDYFTILPAAYHAIHRVIIATRIHHRRNEHRRTVKRYTQHQNTSN